MNFTLRPWAITDLNDLVHFANNFAISKNLTDKFPYPYTAENGKWFISFATQDDPIHIFAIDIDGQAVGGIGVHPQEDVHRMNAELGYWLAEPFWGQGIMPQAIIQMIEFGFRTFDIDRIFARPFGSNKASQRVLEKSGFILEARFSKTLFKNGEYEDELVYAVRRNS